MSLREEIFEIIRDRYIPSEYYIVEKKVNEITKAIEKRIDDRIQYAEHELKKGQHDFEGKQNLRYEIERLKDLKPELFK